VTDKVINSIYELSDFKTDNNSSVKVCLYEGRKTDEDQQCENDVKLIYSNSPVTTNGPVYKPNEQKLLSLIFETNKDYTEITGKFTVYSIIDSETSKPGSIGTEEIRFTVKKPKEKLDTFIVIEKDDNEPIIFDIQTGLFPSNSPTINIENKSSTKVFTDISIIPKSIRRIKDNKTNIPTDPEIRTSFNLMALSTRTVDLPDLTPTFIPRQMRVSD
jgi:hypothetical protein